MSYKIACLEMDCTCPSSMFNPKTVCKHVKPICNRGNFYESKDGAPRFIVWKLKDRWYAAQRYRGFVSDSLPELMEALV